MQSSQLMKLFEDGLKDMLWAEKAITKAIPKMINNSTSVELIDILVEHLDETHEQVERLNLIFASIDKKPVAKKCNAIEGLIQETEAIMEDCELGAMCDAGIIMAGQKIEHYEIASYGTLRQFAELLGLNEAETLLEASLNEEKSADLSLSEIAQCINLEAAEEDLQTLSSANSQPH